MNEVLTRRLQMFWVSVWIYNIALTCTKISLLIQYMRLFAVSSARIVCWIVITATVIFGLFSVFGNIFLCTPVERWWNKSIPGHCLDEASVWLSNSGEYIVIYRKKRKSLETVSRTTRALRGCIPGTTDRVVLRLTT